MAVAYESLQTTAWASSASITITKPTGLAVGDLMIGRIYGNISTDTPTAPSGWTQLVVQNISGRRNIVYHKIANAGDVAATNFTWSWSGAGFVAGEIFRFSDAKLVVNFDTDTESSNGGTKNFTDISITPANEMPSILLALFAGRNYPLSATVSGYAVVNNNPSWTEVFDDYNGTDDVVISSAYGTYNAVTATGAFSCAVSAGGGTQNSGVILLAVERDVIILQADVGLFTLSLPATTTLTKIVGTLKATLGRFILTGNQVDSKKTIWKNDSKNETNWTND